jgi:hypothetical protein
MPVYQPDSLYWCHSPHGPTMEQRAFGHLVTNGLIGPIGGDLAQKFEALGYVVTPHVEGQKVTGWIYNSPGVPGWSITLSPLQSEASAAATPGCPAFSSLDPDSLDWPNILSRAWLENIKRYDLRSGERRR